MDNAKISAHVIMVQDDLVTIKAVNDPDRSMPLKKNAVIYILPSRTDKRRQERLKAEILRIHGNTADAQVFESTLGVAVGDPVEQTEEMLSVSLGPGLLGQVYDGLQNPLENMAAEFGYFLPRGIDADALDRYQKWSFISCVRSGDKLVAGDVIGTVQEGRYTHKIMVPFDEPDQVAIVWIIEDNVTVDTPIARIRNLITGHEKNLSLMQKWPVRQSIPEHLLRKRSSHRLYPDQPLMTTMRIIDTFFPIALGGTACIPGPFGAGKTVLQSLISRFSSVDLVIVVACGERAGEVVETISEFPKMIDPKTGSALMDRTIIICNTSSMPVAAREASIYTGITLGEYYRQMGFNVLLLADSTSRWAQAMRETSGRMEEIPGEEAFPAYLDSSIRSIYERAGVIRNNHDETGSLTMIGTVSPAGGNFEEPVTQSTLNTVKTFIGLSADRAYKRFYPAVDPLISWSRYLKQLQPWFEKHIEDGWTRKVQEMIELLHQGDAVLQMMQVTGEEGVTLKDYIIYQKALFLDMVYLQQDAFDKVDATSPMKRQQQTFSALYRLINLNYAFNDKAQALDYFTRLTGLCKNFNYAPENSPEYQNLLQQIEELAEDMGVVKR